MAEKEVIEKLEGEKVESPEEDEFSEGKEASQEEEQSDDSSKEESADGHFSKKDSKSMTKELEQITDQLQRQAAEFQNYRRRTEQEKSQMVLFGKSMVIHQLLDVFDDFHRSIEASNQAFEDGDTAVVAAYESLKSGVELAYQKLMDELKKMDVAPVDAVGQPFDEELHEAVMQQAVGADEEVGVVISEIQRGFRMGEKVLRHAKVVVSAKAEQDDS